MARSPAPPDGRTPSASCSGMHVCEAGGGVGWLGLLPHQSPWTQQGRAASGAPAVWGLLGLIMGSRLPGILVSVFMRPFDFSPKPVFTTVCWGDHCSLSPRGTAQAPGGVAAASTVPPLSLSLCSTRVSSEDTRVPCSRPARFVPPGHTLGSACPQAAAASGAPL